MFDDIITRVIRQEMKYKGWNMKSTRGMKLLKIYGFLS